MAEAPEKIWRTTNGYIYSGPTPEPCVEYVRADIADARSAALSSKLGQLTILLLQEAYADARELALQIKVEFPDGSPVATLRRGYIDG